MVCMEGVILSDLRLCGGERAGERDGVSSSVGDGESGGLIDTPESFLLCLLEGFAGSSGRAGISMMVAVTFDFGLEEPDPDLRGFGRTIANWGDDELCKRTFLTTGCPFFEVDLTLVTSEADFELGSFGLLLESVLLCLLCLSPSVLCCNEYADIDMRTDSWLNVSNASCREISETLVKYL